MDGKKVVMTAIFGIATLALTLAGSFVSEKFTSNGMDMIEDIKKMIDSKKTPNNN